MIGSHNPHLTRAPRVYRILLVPKPPPFPSLRIRQSATTLALVGGPTLSDKATTGSRLCAEEMKMQALTRKRPDPLLTRLYQAHHPQEVPILPLQFPRGWKFGCEGKAASQPRFLCPAVTGHLKVIRRLGVCTRTKQNTTTNNHYPAPDPTPNPSLSQPTVLKNLTGGSSYSRTWNARLKMTKWITVVPSPAFPVKHMTDLSGQGIGVEDERDREGRIPKARALPPTTDDEEPILSIGWVRQLGWSPSIFYHVQHITPGLQWVSPATASTVVRDVNRSTRSKHRSRGQTGQGGFPNRGTTQRRRSLLPTLPHLHRLPPLATSPRTKLYLPPRKKIRRDLGQQYLFFTDCSAHNRSHRAALSHVPSSGDRRGKWFTHEYQRDGKLIGQDPQDWNVVGQDRIREALRGISVHGGLHERQVRTNVLDSVWLAGRLPNLQPPSGGPGGQTSKLPTLRRFTLTATAVGKIEEGKIAHPISKQLEISSHVVIPTGNQQPRRAIPTTAPRRLTMPSDQFLHTVYLNRPGKLPGTQSKYFSSRLLDMEQSTPPTPFNYHPLDSNAINPVATLPVDALTCVCEQLESSSAKDVTMLKHEVNQTILALLNVCRSWRYHVISCKSLFRNIAFDISSEESIVTAGVFLNVLRGTAVPINVYARVGQSLNPDPMITALFNRLRPHLSYIIHFEYDGDIASYRSYLNHPTPNLLFFSDNFDTYPGNGPPLFCGQMPRLRALTTLSQAPQIIWATSTLSDLTTLNLGFLGSDLHVPLGSFLDLLRGTPRLESLSVQSFTPAMDPAEDLEDVLLPCLQSLILYHNEFHTLIKKLRTPVVRKVIYVGESHAVSGAKQNPTFEAPHLFAGFPLFPIFNQPIKTVRLGTTGNGRTDASFRLELTADGGFVLRVLLYWVLDSIPSFDGYVKRSVLGLAGTMTLAPQAQVELLQEDSIPLGNPVYQPLFLFTEIDQLTIKGDFAVDVLETLTLHTGAHHLLPRLRVLTITDRALASHTEGRRTLVSCLQSRAIGDALFSVRLVDASVCNVEFGRLGCIVKREFQERLVGIPGVSHPSVIGDTDDPRFVVISADFHDEGLIPTQPCSDI
ncbi:hypothetical protein BJ322DRAFT_1184327 [Thelephora terrestris]|uniref:Uncharacterized protein n=1 Tax=Thelephora terrestris TaxID=56493 RepID=A0A9P6HGQ4_9AGAM|nr:hypothetical protein BJ322DRAFT_1184327 [Thelephora terrestris]